MRRVSRAILRGAALCAVLFLGAPERVGAQGHPFIGPGPSLHTRLRQADAVVLARVRAVQPGRLRLERLRTLVGEVPERFSLKRSPLAPPPHGVDDLGLFFLRGARSPYVSVEAPREVLRIGSEEDGRALAQAVEALGRAGDDPAALLALHVTWLEGTNATLTRLALAAFLDPEAPFAPIPEPESFAVARADTAADPGRAPEARRAAAALAALQPAGLARLLAWAPGNGSDVDVEILALSLNQAAILGAPETEGALVRTLGADDPAARGAALVAARRLRTGLSPELRVEVERLAARDESDEVRSLARRLLERQRGRGDAGT
jgi:hypothetical protein